MQVPELISALYSAGMLLAFVVVWLYWRPTWQALREGDFGNSFNLSVGILVCWLAEGVTRAWWAAWRWGLAHEYDVRWMVTHPIVALCGSLLILGALFHIRAGTRAFHGEWAWLAAAAVGAVAFCLSWFNVPVLGG